LEKNQIKYVCLMQIIANVDLNCGFTGSKVSF
jgi:hypothetical protein